MILMLGLLGLVAGATAVTRIDPTQQEATEPQDDPAPGKAAPAHADPAPQRAASAAAFVDSIGVNTHLHYDDTAYDRFDDIVRPRLLELGVRHVRDGAYTYDGVSGDSFYYQRLRDLGQEGVRFNLITSIATPQSERTDLSQLGDVVRWSGGAVTAFEGTNEPDLTGPEDWVARTRDLQRELWQIVQDDTALRQVAVIGPSPVWSPDALGDVSAWTDYGNWHAYPGGACPSCADASGQGFDSRVDAYRRPTGSAPLMVTETGYHNAVTGEQDHRPASEEAAGRYVPRLLFEYFNRGVARSYLYELIDQHDDPTRQDREASFGLLRNDGSPKPAYVSLRNLIRILADDGGPTAPTSLAFELQGQTDRVHHTLLHKRDGRFYLALWQARSTYDTGQGTDGDARRELRVRPQRVTVATARRMAGVKLFVPGQGVTPQRVEQNNRAFAIDVPGEVIVVELTP